MKKLFLIIPGILLILFGALFLWLKSHAPDYDSEILAEGLTEKVIITRNRFAVPSITASSEEDLYFAWGYVNAQDRIFQMEINRRAGQGRLSEFGGESTLSKDYFLRAVGFNEIAKKEVDNLSPEMKRLLQRYVDGINHYLDTSGTPLYFRLVGIQREKWEISDTLLAGMMLNWVMSYNMKYELLYHKIAEKIGRERCAELIRTDLPDAGTILEGTKNTAIAEISRLLEEMDDLLGSEFASNNWAVSGGKSAYRGALFANDPHVHYSKIPNDWYIVHLKCGEFEAAGAQVAGAPFLVLGYNDAVAWGITNNNADIVDLFFENIDREKKTYRYRGRDLPLVSRNETFRVKGGDPVEKTFYYANEKPILNDVFTDIEKPVSLYWSAFDGVVIDGFNRLMKAENYGDFVQAIRAISIVPLNIAYGDREGNIAYHLMGRLPNRLKGTGNFIESGEDLVTNWNGYHGFEKNPSLFNPGKGFVATANNRVTRGPLYMNGTYHPAYRYERIEEMLRQKDGIDVDYVKKMHLDTETLLKERMLSIIEKYVSRDGDRRIPQAVDILKTWDGSVATDSNAPSIYNTFTVRFMYNTFEDELGKELAEQYASYRQISLDRFFELIQSNSPFFDDIKTPGKESVADIATESFIETLKILEDFFGSENMKKWTWGKIHQIRYEHLTGKSSIMRPFVNIGPLPFPGDNETVNNGRFLQVTPPYIVDLTAGVRMIVSFDEKPEGHFTQMTGENEFFLSRHYSDMTGEHLEGRYFCLEKEEAVYETVLLPR